MKTLRLLLLLMLTLALTLSSFTSCEQLEKMGINIGKDKTPDETPEEPKTDDFVDPATCGHYVTVTKNKVEATCTKEGYSGDEVCYACGTTVKIGKTTPPAHNYVNGVCSVCGDTAVTSTITVADARLEADGEIVKVSGVVARLTFANGMIPSGFYLIDGTSSIYVYDGNIAARVAIGNTVTLVGIKDHWILDTEISNAEKFGYQGCNQITDCVLVSNDGGNTAFNTDWIADKTVKQIMDTPVTEDITTLTYKVTARIRKAVGTGFTNYYIDDLDGKTGTYVYTQCSGKDFTWLDEFDGKICTVYLSALNAKSTSSGCNWRFLPVAVIDENFTFDLENTPEFAVRYYGVTNFDASYMTGAKVELPTLVDSELLGFTGASLVYTVSDNTVADIIEEDGKLYFVTLGAGTVKVTVTGNYASAEEYSESVSITVTKPQDNIESITVSDAIKAEVGTEVVVKGIVGPSTVGVQAGTFYLIDEGGVIPVKGKEAATFMAGLKIGHEVVVKGTRSVTKDGAGQIVILDAEIVANYYGEHEYSTASFNKTATMADIKAIADSPEATTNVFVITVTVKRNKQTYSTNYYAGDVMLYTSGDDYKWIMQTYLPDANLDNAGELTVQLTVELALCDWNAKGLKGSILAVYNADGTKTYNTTNFQ